MAVSGHCTVQDVHFLGWCEHLGACIGSPPARQWRAFPKHQRRLDKAEGASFKIGLLPVVVQHKVLDSRCFSISRFAYGWINRFPPTKWCQRLDQKVWKSLGQYQYSVPELKQVIVGGHLSISACVIWRATRLLAIRDFARAQLGAQWNPVALDEEVRARLTGLGWYLSGDRWCHVIFPSGFSLSEIVEDKIWAKAAHFLRESWRKQSFERLMASGRHEFQGELIPAYSSDRIRLAKSWADSMAYL